jgi:phosphate transport system protein
MSARQHEESTMGSPDDGSRMPVMETAESIVAEAVGIDRAARADQHVIRMRESLDAEMLGVKEGVLRMGSLVEEQILSAHDALMNRDAELARKVIASDGQINEVQRAVTALVAMTIATQAPVARDLRFLLALDRVTYELERMGDHAGSVAKQARKLAGNTSMVTYDELTPMATLAARQVRDVVMALVDIDEERARQVAARDDEIDRLYHQVFDDVLQEMRTDPAKVDPGTRILFAAHYLERIGDRVTNIAEDVVFLATGEVEDLNP